MNDNQEKPCLVNCTGQGFSVLNTIDYKGRLLYSKYNPVRNIVSVIQNLNLLPGTLIYIFSPGLWYGIEDLKKILPQNCPLIAVEADEQLYNLSKQYNSTQEHFFRFTTQEDVSKLDEYLKQICQSGLVRRAIRIDFCAGTQFFPEQYNSILSATTNLISTFWKNRITLGKMGKLYARNIFRNLIKTANDNWIDNYRATVTKPVLVCGAGESLDHFDWNNANEKYFILACDAAVMALKARGVKIDAMVCLESQLAIEKMFIGCEDSTPLFMDIASRTTLSRFFKNIIWFSTKYSSTDLLETLHTKGIIEQFLTPNGSVGLTAVELALQLRNNDSVPVYVLGLDFSYSCGQTHAKGTNPHLVRLTSSDRLHPPASYDACFGENSIRAANTEKNTFYTTPVLSSYAKAFCENFSKVKNIFNAGTTGLDLSIPYRIECGSSADNKVLTLTVKNAVNEKMLSAIVSFYQEQKNDLTTSLDLLSKGENSQFRNSQTLSDQLTALLKDKDYLWLHFPDGTQFNLSTSFLKRIKAEIHFFVKQIDTALKNR